MENSKTSIDEFLNNLPDNLEDKNQNNIIPKKIKLTLDYNSLLKEVNKKTTEIVKENVLFFFDEAEVKKEPYIREKMKVDFITISNLLFQMKTSEYAIVKLLELIDEGSGNVRQFEVLGRLQSSKMEIVKQLQATMTTMELNYKSLRSYFKEKEQEGRIEIEESKKETVKTNSGKELIQSIRAVLENSDDIEKKENEKKENEKKENEK